MQRFLFTYFLNQLQRFRDAIGQIKVKVFFFFSGVDWYQPPPLEKPGSTAVTAHS